MQRCCCCNANTGASYSVTSLCDPSGTGLTGHDFDDFDGHTYNVNICGGLKTTCGDAGRLSEACSASDGTCVTVKQPLYVDDVNAVQVSILCTIEHLLLQLT